MNLYLLKRNDRVGYDETAGFVIRAETVKRAVEIATADEWRDDAEIWRNKKYVDITLIGTGPGEVEEIILRDYRAG